MKLAWHIAKKDLRRIAPAIVTWLALIVVPTIVFATYSPRIDGESSIETDVILGVGTIWIRLLLAVQFIIGYVIAGTVLLEDRLVGTNSFWLSRPISNRRLFAAKWLAAVVAFVGIPVVMLAAVWLANGFTAQEVALAAFTFTKIGILTVLLAFMVASLSRNLAQFLLFTVLIAAALFASIPLSSFFSQVAPPALRTTRHLLASWCMLGAVVVVVTQQFFLRRAAHGWIVLGIAFFVTVGIRAAWPWDISSVGARAQLQARSPERPEDRAAAVVVDSKLTKFSPRSVPTLFVTTDWTREHFYFPAFGRLPDGRIVTAVPTIGARDAGLRALGFQKETGPLRWQMMLPYEMHRTQGDDIQVKGLLELWSVDTRQLGEMPVRIGEQIVHGANRSRIVALDATGEQLNGIVVEERDSSSGKEANLERSSPFMAFGSIDLARVRYFDQYFLVNRAEGRAVLISGNSRPAIELNAFSANYRRLSVHSKNNWRNAVLVKLRFERDRSFERPFEARGMTLRGGSGK